MKIVKKKKLSSDQRQRWLWWLKYLGVWLLSNGAVWGLVWAYLELLPPTYTSQWGLMVLGTNPGVDINIPEVGQASSSNQGSASVRPQPYQDIRSDYVYLANSPEVLARAAKLVKLSVDDFGEPDITTDDNSAIIAFEITGDTPEQAQKKSEALYQVLSEEIEKLKQKELQRRAKETRDSLEAVRQQLSKSKNKLANYRSQANLSSEDQIQALATNVETLRQQKAQLFAQEQASKARLKQLAKDVDFSDEEVAAAYTLKADQVYQQQFQVYSQINTDLSDLLSQLGAEHPLVVEKKNELNYALVALQKRANLTLGRTISQTELIKLASITLDPKLTTVRQDLFKDLVTTRAEQQATLAQIQEITRQLNTLEKQLKVLTQEKSKLDSLKADVDVSQAIFSATLAKLDLSKGNIDIIYPPVQLVGGPNLPNKDEPTSPDLNIGLIGGAAGSFIVMIGFVLYWWENWISSKEARVFEKMQQINENEKPENLE
jgi:uncharacterized protein involved in exopolysaccharide biosynthesis